MSIYGLKIPDHSKFVIIGRIMFKIIKYPWADSYGKEKLKLKYPKSVFFGGGQKHIVGVNPSYMVTVFKEKSERI